MSLSSVAHNAAHPTAPPRGGAEQRLQEVFHSADCFNFVTRHQLMELFQQLSTFAGWTDDELDALFDAAELVGDRQMKCADFLDWLLRGRAIGSCDGSCQRKAAAPRCEAAAEEERLPSLEPGSPAAQPGNLGHLGDAAAARCASDGPHDADLGLEMAAPARTRSARGLTAQSGATTGTQDSLNLDQLYDYIKHGTPKVSSGAPCTTEADGQMPAAVP
eukprot:TRINITY_DN80066_c0_g1_i1.p1 TRINITY_DN80066_c0_g1~~TRINITY_DN80066_c0_g1_i1.p1  ORF type:complete len:218 (+),score=51.40 TRINITY_DN80066_c0_g1_i1:83-736(+)